MIDVFLEPSLGGRAVTDPFITSQVVIHRRCDKTLKQANDSFILCIIGRGAGIGFSGTVTMSRHVTSRHLSSLAMTHGGADLARDPPHHSSINLAIGSGFFSFNAGLIICERSVPRREASPQVRVAGR
ncbi:hypothetical protein EVAR_70709_1 [Eumeta japonica]|uniref:Uncharacterized protein n=1 Tax=Eumeta variegata TaxID=151549 RepID=A0A4C2A5V5_EUMVA|nr:hypothetical protein EVAR_70709_1 [Eumeta japonica]